MPLQHILVPPNGTFHMHIRNKVSGFDAIWLLVGAQDNAAQAGCLQAGISHPPTDDVPVVSLCR